MHQVFISGGTGYIGRVVTAELVARGHRVRVLARAGSERKVPTGAAVVRGDALQMETFSEGLTECDTVIHLTGVAHPAPWKEAQFRAIDLASLRASARAAHAAKVGHFVYVSVAHPAPMMKAYIRVRTECERILEGLGLTCTILRPWYVLGPGHRWPVLLKPVYKALESVESTREGARRLGLVTLAEMRDALVWAVENPPAETRIVDVPGIRACAVPSL